MFAIKEHTLLNKLSTLDKIKHKFVELTCKILLRIFFQLVQEGQVPYPYNHNAQKNLTPQKVILL